MTAAAPPRPRSRLSVTENEIGGYLERVPLDTEGITLRPRGVVPIQQPAR